MGKPIAPEKERRIKRLLSRGNLSLREIAAEVGCAPGTVRRVSEGKSVKREPSSGQTVFRACAPYVCLGCSERVGREVKVGYRPCVACTARRVARREGVQQGWYNRAAVAHVDLPVPHFLTSLTRMSWHSPLFQQAGRAVLDAARQEFAGSTTGRLFREVEREFRRTSTAPHRLERALKRYSGFGVRDALRELRGTQFGQFAREIERYARGGGEMKRLLNQFLGELGPAGRLIKALTGPQGRGEVDKLISILQAFGYEVLPSKRARRVGEPVTERGLAAAQELLESMGAEVIWPEDRRERKGGRLPFDIPAYGESGEPRENVPLPMADGPAQRFGVKHPIVTGEMVPAASSNVHSFGYDIESAYLYVRFLGYVRGTKGADGHALRSGAGSLYRYRDVTPEEFLSLLAANSKGSWVWDHLRIRGTWSGHQKDYELVGVMGNYVPRKATVRVNPQTGQLQEWFAPRRVRAIGGGWLRSALPSETAGPLPWGQIDRGEPNRGMPDRGEPDRGEPDRGR